LIEIITKTDGLDLYSVDRAVQFEGNLFCFFSLPRAKKETPQHLAHIGKAPRAHARTEASPKSAILLTHTLVLKFYLWFLKALL